MRALHKRTGDRGDSAGPREATLVRLLVAESQPLIRRGLCAVLDDEPDLAVIAQAGDAEVATEMAAESRPHVVLVGFRLCGDGGSKLIRELARATPPIPTLVLSDCKTPAALRQALDAGAWGFLLKNEPPERIIEAVRGIASGHDGWLSREVVACLRDAWHDPLTPKETEVVRHLAAGNNIQSIAARLQITVRTARNHLTNVYGKLDLHSQPELVAWAWRSGMAS